MTATVTPAGRIRHVATPSLPSRTPGLAVGELTPQPLPDGRVELRDARGEFFGLFANEQLARSTAAFLTR